MDYREARQQPPDFEVAYRFFTEEEGGRHSGPAWQHYHCDWAYKGEFLVASQPQDIPLYMIWPEFLNPDGSVFPDGSPVPWSGRATMWIVVSEMRASVHCARIKKGVRGYFMEGPRRVGEAVVTKILGLHTNPKADK